MGKKIGHYTYKRWRRKHHELTVVGEQHELLALVTKSGSSQGRNGSDIDFGCGPGPPSLSSPSRPSQAPARTTKPYVKPLAADRRNGSPKLLKRVQSLV